MTLPAQQNVITHQTKFEKNQGRRPKMSESWCPTTNPGLKSTMIPSTLPANRNLMFKITLKNMKSIEHDPQQEHIRSRIVHRIRCIHCANCGSPDPCLKILKVQTSCGTENWPVRFVCFERSRKTCWYNVGYAVSYGFIWFHAIGPTIKAAGASYGYHLYCQIQLEPLGVEVPWALGYFHVVGLQS